MDDCVKLFLEMQRRMANKEKVLARLKRESGLSYAMFMRNEFEDSKDADERQKCIAEILDVDYADADFIISEIARKAIKGTYPMALKKKAALVLYHNGCMTPKEKKRKSFTDILEAALKEEALDKKDEVEQKTNDFTCYCCHRHFSIDDMNDPDLQKDICNECWDAGKCYEPDEFDEYLGKLFDDLEEDLISKQEKDE